MPRPAPRQDAVLAVLRERGGACRLAQVAEACDMTTQDAWSALTALRKRGRVENPARGVWRFQAAAGASPAPDAPRGALSEDTPEREIVLPRPLPDTGLRQANPFLIQDALLALTRWGAAYSGPANDPTAVSVVMASMHLQHALGIPDEELIPRSRGWHDLSESLER